MADKKITVMAQFYEQCQTKGYIDMTDATQSLKAKVIATDLNLKYKDIAELYEKSAICYQQVQAEDAETERKAGIERKAAEEEAARRAVDGELLVSILNSEKSKKSEEIMVKVYVRPDQSIYSVVNNGDKIEGAPSIMSSKGGVLTTTYHPSQAVYTGASSGGITMGGVHYTQASYSEKISKTENGDVEISVGETKFTIKRIIISPLVKSRFRRDQAFNNYVRGDTIQCFVHSATADMLVEAAMTQNLDYAARMNTLSVAVDKRRLPYNTCVGIANLLGRIVHCQFPPSDEEYYAEADALSKKTTSAELKRAVEIFTAISDYRDAEQRVKLAESKYEEILQEEKENAVLEKEAAAKRRKKSAIAAVAIMLVAAVVAGVLLKVVLPNKNYNEAMTLLKSGDLVGARELLLPIADYKDARTHLLAIWDELAVRETISTGDHHTVGLKKDGRVVATGLYSDDYREVSAWRDIVAISARDDHTVALKTDGTVVAAGENNYGQCDVSEWTDIVAIDTGFSFTVGLKVDGTVVIASDSSTRDVSGWRNIVAVSAGSNHAVGLKADGTVVATGVNDDGQCDVSNWRDIVAISAGNSHTVGLKADGTVVATGSNFDSECTGAEKWDSIVAVAAGNDYTVGLKADGKVVAVGENNYGQCDVSEWTDIVAISAGVWHTVGLKADGTVVAAGGMYDDEVAVSDWYNIRLPGN